MSHLSTLASAEVFVDLVDGNRNMLEALAEEMEASGLYLLKLLMAFLSYTCASLKCYKTNT